jgi:hypothetical protein
MEPFSWLWHAAQWTWTDPEGYNVFSGPLADITILTALGVFLYHRNCHVKGCWRLAWKNYVDPSGHTHALCKKHHPHDPPTAATIQAAADQEAAASQPK